MLTPTKQTKAQVAWLAALAEPTRIAVLLALARGEKTVTELSALCRMHSANMSHHLSMLKAVALITTEARRAVHEVRAGRGADDEGRTRN